MKAEDVLVAHIGSLTDPQAPAGEIEACLPSLRELVPSLRVLQLFDLFDAPTGTPLPQSS